MNLKLFPLMAAMALASCGGSKSASDKDATAADTITPAQTLISDTMMTLPTVTHGNMSKAIQMSRL